MIVKRYSVIVKRYRLHGVQRVHGYKIGSHWRISYAIAALFYRVKRMYRPPDRSEHVLVIRLNPRQAEWQLTILKARLKADEQRQG